MKPRYRFLATALADGGHVVTAGRRLARDLISQFSADRLAAGVSAWATPSIMTFDAWLQRFANAAGPNHGRLRPIPKVAEKLLWDRQFRRELDDPIANPLALARQALPPLGVVRNWQIPPGRLASTARSPDEQLFAACVAGLDSELQARGFCSSGDLPFVLAGDIEQGRLADLPPRITFTGFDQVSPAHEALIAALRQKDCLVDLTMPERAGRVETAASFATRDEELRAAGAWARGVLQDNPTARVAVVRRFLDDDARADLAALRDGLTPGWQVGSVTHWQAVGTASSRRLTAYPAIGVALLCLEWTVRALSGREISLLLRSPLVAGGDLDRRSELEMMLRGEPDRSWKPEAFIESWAGRSSHIGTGRFLELVRELDRFSRDQEKRYSPRERVLAIRRLLAVVGWPGGETRRSAEQQLVSRWNDLLAEIAGASALFPAMDAAELVRLIVRSARDTAWQPEPEVAGRIEYLSAPETAGLEFDALWIAGLDADTWPGSFRPSPFISRSLHDTYRLPGGSPLQAFDEALAQLLRLTGSADSCVLSWAELVGESETMASALLSSIDSRPKTAVESPQASIESLVGAEMETIQPQDDRFPAVASGERLRGGAYTILRQHEEPFGGFAFGRLGVTRLHEFACGLSASHRGTLVHDALYHLLSDRPTQAQLESWGEDERGRRVGVAIDTAIAGFHRHPDPLLRELLALERDRMRTVLSGFLEAEAVRPSFRVSDLERETRLQFNEMQFEFRIDRVDALDDGTLLVCDYKTGDGNSGKSGNIDPVFLQLAAYAESIGPSVSTLLCVRLAVQGPVYTAVGPGWAPQNTVAADPEVFRNALFESLSGLLSGDGRVSRAPRSHDARSLSILSRVAELSRAR